jgi:hypothetical protein
VTTVTAAANDAGRVLPGREGHVNFVLLMRTAKSATVKVRVDTVSPRPHAAAYYSLQGTLGCYESWRGLGDEPKVWLADDNEPSRCMQSPPWRPLSDYAARYIPDRLAAGEAARAGGHGTSEHWMLRDFIRAVQRNEAPPIDVFRALDYTVPGICALESVEAGGAPVPVPDFRERLT